MGHSRGGGASLHYVLTEGDVQAVVLNSAPYTPEFIERASQLSVPVLILHGTADSPDDGGSALTDVTMARRFESALRGSGKNLDVKYYEGGKHNSLFGSPAQRKDELQRMSHFLREVLGRGNDRRTGRDR